MFGFESRVELASVLKFIFDEVDEFPSFLEMLHHRHSANFIAGKERQKGGRTPQVAVDEPPQDGPQLRDRQNLQPFDTLGQHSRLGLLRQQVAEGLDVSVVEVFSVKFLEVVGEDVEDLELLLVAVHQGLHLPVAFKLRRKKGKHVVNQIGLRVLLQTLLPLSHHLLLPLPALLLTSLLSQRSIASLFHLYVASSSRPVRRLEVARRPVFFVAELDGGGVVHAEGVLEGESRWEERWDVRLFGSVVVGNEGRGVVECCLFVGGEESGLR